MFAFKLTSVLEYSLHGSSDVACDNPVTLTMDNISALEAGITRTVA